MSHAPSTPRSSPFYTLRSKAALGGAGAAVLGDLSARIGDQSKTSPGKGRKDKLPVPTENQNFGLSGRRDALWDELDSFEQVVILESQVNKLEDKVEGGQQRYEKLKQIAAQMRDKIDAESTRRRELEAQLEKQEKELQHSKNQATRRSLECQMLKSRQTVYQMALRMLLQGDDKLSARFDRHLQEVEKLMSADSSSYSTLVPSNLWATMRKQEREKKREAAENEAPPGPDDPSA
eukprot:CAMPEP_0204334494 /NCGR_PEP_ID=MMETSP0469-20131031/18065_1 /ASSEMBLY_ACC=CAM_ASM_000384 /TAXON_ID=2969 /ORGANISM="Oxyrrhis marina" /LENGTH=234 /DNA_ID=CAMNT_0051318019 /DNA_START=46 /DNA_END=750 /DNA_ORIENTATION=-